MDMLKPVLYLIQTKPPCRLSSPIISPHVLLCDLTLPPTLMDFFFYVGTMVARCICIGTMMAKVSLCTEDIHWHNIIGESYCGWRGRW